MNILFDQNFNYRILHGLVKKIPTLNFVTTQELSKEREEDSELIDWATKENRVILTHDINTFPKFAYAKIAKGEKTVGVLIVPQDMPIGEAINELEIIITCSLENEFENRVEYLPFGL